jgi:hypothetical protein
MGRRVVGKQVFQHRHARRLREIEPRRSARAESLSRESALLAQAIQAKRACNALTVKGFSYSHDASCQTYGAIWKSPHRTDPHGHLSCETDPKPGRVMLEIDRQTTEPIRSSPAASAALGRE